MHSAWFKGHSRDKTQRRKEVEGYKNAFDELDKILTENFKPKESVRDYSDPNWMANQIAVNEYNQVLKDIQKLIKL
jgi:hypothetical protein